MPIKLSYRNREDASHSFLSRILFFLAAFFVGGGVLVCVFIHYWGMGDQTEGEELAVVLNMIAVAMMSVVSAGALAACLAIFRKRKFRAWWWFVVLGGICGISVFAPEMLFNLARGASSGQNSGTKVAWTVAIGLPILAGYFLSFEN